MDGLTADGLIVNFSWGREEIQRSDYGRAPDSPTVWAGVEGLLLVVGLQVGDYSVPVTLGEDGGEGRCGYATTLPPRVPPTKGR